MTHMAEVSIIVATMIKDPANMPCYHALESCPYDDYELVVRNDDGLSTARNRGVREATTDKIIFFDDDSRPFPGSVAAAADGLDEYAAVTGRTVHPYDGPTSHVARYYETGSDSKEIDKLYGCNMAFRREVFDEVGLFDERFTWGHDETEFAHRVQKRYSIRYLPDMKVEHPYTESVPDFYRKMWRFGLMDPTYERAVDMPLYERLALYVDPRRYVYYTPTGTVLRATGNLVRNVAKTYAWIAN
jgi:glycosyltransferase involved in cell wall biosynthesis